ncbi:VWA domain-containing protein [Roseibium polysiphoniae]|uniref:VWA domain-containing protein n=1 Tax=Roseibium polysiphoniae TaxID=2571221 RepID=A0ABR9CD35_9HYPH|nr:VWA domain-containing protein [Roseibium polysiphoniae]MBD8877498.1 VWA domain-containing protein [Roseibium polysiphoniae]
MIEFAHPWAFLLLPLPLAVYWLVPPHKEQVSALRFPFFRRLSDAAGRTPQAGAVIFRRTTLQNLAAIAIWALLVSALATPERVGAPIVQEKAARDVMLAIDISGSMDQNDFLSTEGERTQRLEAVKKVVGDFIESRDGDRVALIVFGAKAFVQAPFTEDLASVRALLEQTEVGMAGPHTVLGDAIGLSIKTFQASQIKDRLLILLSDGADTGSRMTPVNAAAIAAREGIEIISIGVGDPDGTGDQRLDERTLTDIADASGGAYYFAGDEAGLAEIYARIDAQKPREVETRSFRPREPLSHFLLVLAALTGVGAVAFLHIRKERRRVA